MPRTVRHLFLACMILGPLEFALAAKPAPEETLSGTVEIEFFENKIRPVLVDQCYRCHSARADKVQGKLLLDTREGIRSGGESGPAVVPGSPRKSLLLEAIRYDGLEMPPDRRLDGKIVADFERWITMGAPDPRDHRTSAQPPAGMDVEAGKQFWAFQPPERHPPPSVRQAGWVRQPIDAFVLARIEQAGLRPSKEADRRLLLRRAYFDVIGLPPTPAELDQFLHDSSSDAYEKTVERLLESAHYGERWARLWLDVSRYAEDQAHIVGNNQSLFYPNAYLYRDWVIKSLNDDLRYDEFIRQQLAGDLIKSKSGSHDLAALGFLGLGPKYYRRNAPEVMADEWEDRVDTVTRGLLGLTVACARCHDHKYDPIETDDYYALAGVFASTEMVNHPLDPSPEKEEGEIEKEKGKNGKDSNKAAVRSLHIIRDTRPTDLHIFIRGDVNAKGSVVKRRFLKVLSPGEPPPFTQGSGRLELARSIASASNPLTARVIVNRVWGQYFGRPLVSTPSNFGRSGSRPSHPKLLDDLAVRFVENGWSMKWLHRQILLSATYRQSSIASEQTMDKDFSNELLGRFGRKRLSIEAWRDSVLAVTGRLDRAIGGTSFLPSDPDSTRRTIYSRVSRFQLDPMLALFDFPDPNVHAASRTQTTTPLQKLFVMNSPFMIRSARDLAERLLADDGGQTAMTDEARIQRAYKLLFARSAVDVELGFANKFLQQPGTDRKQLWQQYAQVLLASNEMLFVD